MRRRKQVHTVVTPAETTREFGDGHHFDQRHAVRRELRKLERGGLPSAFGRESPDVHLVDDLPGKTHSGPRCVGPDELRRIDHFGRAVRTVRLEARGWIRDKMRAAVEAKPIQRARTDAGYQRG